MNGARGFTAHSLYRKYYQFIATITAQTPFGDWTVLVDKALAGPAWWNTEDCRHPS
jgi:hypothetical protein